MFINGFVIIGMEINLEDFADICGVTLQEASSALIFRSVGSAIGAFMAGPLLNHVEPHQVLFGCFILAGAMMSLISWNTSLTGIFAIFAIMGMSVCVMQTGVLLLIRKYFPDQTGFWMQAAQFSFQIAVTLFPLMLEYVDLGEVYYFNSVLAMGSGACILATSQTLQRRKLFSDDWENFTAAPVLEDKSKHTPIKEFFATGDVLVAFANFCIGGIVVETTTYLESYTEEAPLTALVDPDMVLFGFTTAILFGQLVMIPLQSNATTARVMTYFVVLSIFAMWSQQVILIFPTSVWVLRIGTICMGFFMGPLSGLLFDLWDKYTVEPSPYGSSLVNFACYAGSGFFSVGTYNLWIEWNNPYILLWTNAMGFFIVSAVGYTLNRITPGCRKLSDEKGDKLDASGEENAPLMYQKS
mmetsp:Transcript_22510/g.29212  ORF Transcript_22510/g.29212 Transcript_22510/m.29212 type:complete len:412 (+) Transcript_22510:2-1237(+)